MRRVAILVLILFKVDFLNCSNLASKKCKEYGRYVFFESPGLSRNSKPRNISECGIVSVPLIIGGSSAKEKEFPHMAVIGFGSTQNAKLAWDCGGSLISENFILTAAHCLESREKGPAQKVRLGSHVLDIKDDDVQEITISERIPHPNYNRRSKSNDIGLIKLQETVIFTPHIRPACLNLKETPEGNKALAAGFGKMSFTANSGSKVLMKVSLTIYAESKCSKVIPKGGKMLESMLCAGEMAGGKDTCQGDSGGPLQIVLDEPYCMYSILGVTSFGKFCGFANSPAIYTKVATYIDWIENIVWK